MASKQSQQKVSQSHTAKDPNPNWFAEHQKVAVNQARSAIQARKITNRENISRSLETITQNLNPNGRDPLEIFPEEVWLLIFYRVKDTGDLFKASRASSVLASILNKWEFLFEKVFAFLEKWLHRKDILVCRQVCVEWRNSVDSFLENYLGGTASPANPEWPYDHYMAEIYGWFRYEIDWDSDEKQVITSVPNKAHETNPFIGRLVSFRIKPIHFGDEEEHEGDTFANLHTFLKNVGTHIWHLDFHNTHDGTFLNDFTSADHCYTTCCKILQNCPNLKTFYFKEHVWGLEHLIWEDTSLSDELPNLPLLEELSISLPGSNKNYEQFQNKLIEKFLQKYDSQLKRLSVGCWDKKFCKFEWKHLEQLKLYAYRAEKEEILQSLLKLNAENLQHLVISAREDDNSESGYHPYFQTLLSVCNHFPKLSRLNLDMKKTVDEIRDQEIAVLPCEQQCCPSVAHMNLKLEDLKIPFSFLVCFPVLSKLELHFISKPGPKRGQSISDCYDEALGKISIGKYLFNEEYLKCMYLSNLWDIMPLLKIFKVDWKLPEDGCYTYTKAGYNAEKIPKEVKAKSQIFMAQQEAVRLKSMGKRKSELSSWLQELGSQMKSRTSQNSSALSATNDPMKNATFREKILPILCAYLGTSALLSCRLVNKQWKTVIDNIIANWNCAKMRFQKNLEPFNDTYWFSEKPLLSIVEETFKTPLSKKDGLRLDQFNLCPQGNPFLGKVVRFTVSGQSIFSEYFRDMYSIFAKYGQHIHHLKISASHKCMEIGSIAYHSLCYKTVKQLKFLKSLSFHNFEIDTAYGSHYEGDFSTLKNDSLEKLSFVSKNEKSARFERLLIEKFAKQIKVLHCSFLRLYEYEPDFFDNLTELKILKPLNSKVLKSLFYMLAPNLENLQLTVAGGVGHYKLLVLLARHFPNLVQLRLKFPKDYSNTLNREIENCTTGFLADTKLRQLIVESYETFVSYDFLCLFPFVQKLSIRHKMKEPLESVKTNKTNVEYEANNEPEEYAVKQAITQIAEYFQLKDSNEQGKFSMYTSNVWEVMVNLQHLEIGLYGDAGVLTKKLFTRNEYIKIANN